MFNIRILAMAALAAFSLTLAPAAARSCDGGCDEAIPAPPANAPLDLKPFLDPSPSAAQAEIGRRRPSRAITTHARRAPAHPAAEPAEDKTAVAQDATPAAKPVKTFDAGLTIAPAGEMNEIDALADQVTIVAADELNEIDAAAGAPLASPSRVYEPTALKAMASTDSPDGQDLAWIGKLLAAFGGSLAVAAVARLLVA